MPRNTAEYSSHHEEYTGPQGERTDHKLNHSTKDKEAAYQDFTKRLETDFPEMARQLSRNEHPLSAEHS